MRSSHVKDETATEASILTLHPRG